MGEVVGLREDSVFAHGEPDLELVALLEQLVSDARSGQLRALAYAAVTSERAINTNWIGHCDLHDMLCGTGILNHRIHANADLDNR